MNRRLRALLFVLCLLWQPLSVLLPAAVDAHAEVIGHAIVHDQAVGHHHHDDASLHMGEADDLPHAHVLDGGQPPALAVDAVDFEPAAPVTGVRIEDVAPPASAELEGRLRPPLSARA